MIQFFRHMPSLHIQNIFYRKLHKNTCYILAKKLFDYMFTFLKVYFNNFNGFYDLKFASTDILPAGGGGASYYIAKPSSELYV